MMAMARTRKQKEREVRKGERSGGIGGRRRGGKEGVGKEGRGKGEGGLGFVVEGGRGGGG